MKNIIEKIKLRLQILQIQLQILLLQKKLTVPNLNDPKFIIIHHGAGQLNFEQVNEYHKSKWGFQSSLTKDGIETNNNMTKIINKPHSYIGYQYFIEKNGMIYRGRVDNEEGAHTIGYNKQSIGICLQGDFEKEEPTPAQMEALEKLVKEKKEQYNINKINGHRNFSNTSCPGKNLYKLIINL